MSSNPENRLYFRDALILAGMVLFSAGAYMLFSAAYYHIGFPLDDAWIHQTYARNLALHGEWSFILGLPSGGSTAPLWSALLAIGFWLKLGPYAWAYLLGAAALWGICMLGESAVRGLTPSYRPRFPFVGMALAFEWHLVWAGVSGMETLLYALLVTAALVLVMSGSRRYFGLGLLIGLTVWVRPDGITLLGPAVLALFLNEPDWKKRLRALVSVLVGCGSLLALYLLFNLLVSGSPLPNTFYAKQAEYASYLGLPFLQRLWDEALQPMIGAGVLLLPGVALALVSSVRRRNWGVALALTWFAGYLILYALRLPVTYQHGRYVIPAMPVFFLLGLAGMMGFGSNQAFRLRWVISSSWRLVVGLTMLVFWMRGAYAYSRDVAFIESEMVTTARWVARWVPEDALVAAHDIGAMGYFGKHDLVDLAGLISPEVIPFIRDEGKLAAYLNERGVSYLVVFPDWYPSLTMNLNRVFTTDALYAPSQGGTNMAVFQWPGP